MVAHSAAPVLVHKLLLPVPPHARRRLLVVRRIPVAVEQHKAVGADEIEAAATGCNSVKRAVICDVRPQIQRNISAIAYLLS